MGRFEEQELEKAGKRIKKAVKGLQELGIVDEKGRRIKRALPCDSQTDRPLVHRGRVSG